MKRPVSFIANSAYQFLKQRRWIRKSYSGPYVSLVHEIGSQGFSVFPAYKSVDWCKATREEITQAMHTDAVTRTDEDLRIFGAEKVSAHAKEFASDPMLKEVASAYAGGDESLLFCMANHLTYREGRYGSGGEWHRDGFRRELKALIYLTDVTESDGPFGLVPHSHKPARMLLDSLRMLPWVSAPTRLKDAGVRMNASRFPGKAGTMILFDASAIHTGWPIEPGGERVALTNYYCPANAVESVLSYYRGKVVLN